VLSKIIRANLRQNEVSTQGDLSVGRGSEKYFENKTLINEKCIDSNEHRKIEII